MTTASKITLIRVAFIPLFMVFMYLSGGQPGLWMWLSLAIFIIASLTDYVDGHIARKYNQVTDFGKFLDPLADKLLVIAAMAMLCDFCRREMNLHKLKVSVFAFNEAAIRCYEKNGFTREGVLEKEVFRDGQYQDVVLMARFFA